MGTEASHGAAPPSSAAGTRMAYQQQQPQAQRSAHVVSQSNTVADGLRRDIQHFDRLIDAKTQVVRNQYNEGRERDALSTTEEIRRLRQDRDNKKTALQRLEKAQGLHSKVSDFVATQGVVKQLTEETKRLATVLDIDEIGETNMESRVVDRELDDMLGRLGLNSEDRQEEEQANRELMLSLLQPAPQVLPHVQQTNTNANSNTVMQQQRPNGNNTNNTTYRSQIDHMLL